METRSAFLRPPRTEQEVVCLFGALLQDLEWPVVVERFQTRFPDCILRRLDTGKRLRAEFELLSSHFIQHGHSLDECDLIICWRNDRPPQGVEVLELRNIIDGRRPDLLQNHDEPAESNESAFLSDAEMHGASEATMALLSYLIDEARKRGWGPQFLPGPEVVLVVGDGAQFFKVRSPDNLGLPLFRLDAGEHFAELGRRLNEACPRLALKSGDERTKGKGGKLAELFAGPAALDQFLDVWEWFRRQRDA